MRLKKILLEINFSAKFFLGRTTVSIEYFDFQKIDFTFSN